MIHESCYIDEPCEIGEGTRIWHFSHVMRDCRIGRNCSIGQNCVISPGVVIGDGSKIQNNVSVYTGVELEEEVFLGPSMVFTNVLTPRAHISRNSPAHFQRTLVRRGATVGANATVVAGLTIGQYALVGAGAVVTRDVPDFAIVYGNPARARGWACHCGAALDFAGVRGQGSEVRGGTGDLQLSIEDPQLTIDAPSLTPDPSDYSRCEECGSRYVLRDGVVEMVEKRMP